MELLWSNAHSSLKLVLPRPQGLSDLPRPLDFDIPEGEMLELAGSVLSVFDGMVVLQGPENSRALSEG